MKLENMRLETQFRSFDLFDSLERESKEVVRKFQRNTKENMALEELIMKFEEFLSIDWDKAGNREYRTAEIICGKSRYNAKDIEKFSLSLPTYQNLPYFNLSGYFLSSIINQCIEEEITLHTIYLERRIDYIGFKNKGKRIIVKGDVGDWAGRYNEGILTIKGSAGKMAGNFMKGGEICIKGNAGNQIGIRMMAGKIVVEGNAGFQVGFEMRGGEIHLQGDYKSVGNDLSYWESYMTGGNIYHKGKLIVKDGREI